MSAYIPSEEVLTLYAQVLARLLAAERLAEALFSWPQAAPAWRREARVALDQAAKAIRKFYDSFSFGADASRDALGMGTEADRRQKAFLVELDASLASSIALMEKRLDPALIAATRQADALDQAALEGRIKASIGDGSGDWPQVAANDLAAFDFLRNLASRLGEEASRLRDAKREALDKELLTIKLRSFVNAAGSVGGKNLELLFKAKTKFERLDAEGAPRSALADAPAGAMGLARTDSGIELSFEGSGVALRLRFSHGKPGRYEGLVSGYVESGGERAEFRLEDPLAKAGAEVSESAAAASFGLFLSRFDLKRLYESSLSVYDKLEEEARLKPAKTAEKLSKALDDIL